MMEGIDPDFPLTHDLLQQTALRHFHAVAWILTQRRLSVRHGGQSFLPAVLAGQILNQRSAQRHIQHLNAPADAQNGLFFFQKKLDQPQFTLIPQGIDLAQALHRLLTKAAGRNVIAPRQ